VGDKTLVQVRPSKPCRLTFYAVYEYAFSDYHNETKPKQNTTKKKNITTFSAMFLLKRESRQNSTKFNIFLWGVTYYSSYEYSFPIENTVEEKELDYFLFESAISRAAKI